MTPDLDWIIPGNFCACVSSDFLNLSSMTKEPGPMRGRIYTVAGSVFFDEVPFIVLAEFPMCAFSPVSFRPTPAKFHFMFRAWLTGNAPITERETVINGRVS